MAWQQYNDGYFLIHEPDPQSLPVVIIVFAHVVRTSVRPHFSKQNKFQGKTIITTGETVNLAQWIIADACLVFPYFSYLYPISVHLYSPISTTLHKLDFFIFAWQPALKQDLLITPPIQIIQVVGFVLISFYDSFIGQTYRTKSKKRMISSLQRSASLFILLLLLRLEYLVGCISC